MGKPKDFRKALYTCMAIVQSAYLSFSLVIYKWCGSWAASPSLGSVGPIIKKVAYNYLLAIKGSICFALIAIALPGFLWLNDFKHHRSGSAGQEMMC